jgi:hypothetical protein
MKWDPDMPGSNGILHGTGELGMNPDMRGALLKSELWGSMSSEDVKTRSTAESVTKPSPEQYGVFSEGSEQ